MRARESTFGPEIKGRRLKVFVSYSHVDMAFVDGLVPFLEAQDLDVLVDRRDLPYGEEWKPELLSFVQQADAVVFVVSPSSVGSRWCRWEVEQVKAESKRLIPIELVPVSHDRLPEQIGEIHILSFADVWRHDLGPLDRFQQVVGTLVAAICDDREWVKEHTRLGSLARQWARLADNHPRRARNVLLRGHALVEAEQWLARRAATAPEATRDQIGFIQESRAAATTGQRWMVAGSLVAALIAFFLAGLAYWQRGAAIENEQAAIAAQQAEKQSRELAEQQRQLAETNEKIADEQRQLATRRSFEAQLRARAAEARATLALDAHAALKTITKAARDNLAADGTLLPEVHAAFAETLQSARYEKHFLNARELDFTDISEFAVTSDQSIISVVGADMIHYLDGAGKPIAAPIPGPHGRHIYANAATWIDDDKLLAVATGTVVGKRVENAGLTLYDRQGKLVRHLIRDHPVPVTSVFTEPKSHILLAGDEAGHLIRVDLRSHEIVIKAVARGKAVHGVFWKNEQTFLATGPARTVTGDVRSNYEDEEDTTLDTTEPKEVTLDDFNFLKQTPIPESDDSGLFCLAHGKGGSPLATCGASGLVNLWSYWDGKLSRNASLRGHTGHVKAISFHPSGEMLATGGADGQIRIWGTNGTLLLKPLQTEGEVRALAFIDGGRKLICGGPQGQLTVWDLSDIGQVPVTIQETNQTASVDFIRLAKGRTFVAGNHFEKGWQIGELIPTQNKKDGGSRRKQLRKSNDGQLKDYAVAFSGARHAWAVGTVATIASIGQSEGTLDLRSDQPIAALAFGPGERIAIVGDPPEDDPATEAAVRAAVTDGDRKRDRPKSASLVLYGTMDGRSIGAPVTTGSAKIVHVAGNITGNGAAFLTIGSQGTLEFWSAQGQRIGAAQRLKGIDSSNSFSEVSAVSAFASDGKQVAIAWSQGISAQVSRVQFWRTDTAIPVGPPLRIQGEIKSIAIDPESGLLFIGKNIGQIVSARHDLEVWGSQGSLLMRHMGAHQLEIAAFGFAKDGALVSYDSNGVSKTWNFRPRDLIQVAARRYRDVEMRRDLEAFFKTIDELEKKGERRRIRELYRAARTQFPTSARVRVRLGNWLPAQTPEEMKFNHDVYSEAIAMGPFNSVHYLQRGKLRHRMGQFKGAIEDFQEAMRLWYCHLRGTLVIADFIPINKVVSEFNWKVQAGAMSEFKRRLGRAYLGNNEWAKAEKMFTHNISGDPDYAAAVKRGVANLSHLKDDSTAQTWLRELDRTPNTATANMYELRGRARYGLKKYDAALEDYDMALKLLADATKPFSSETDAGGKMENVAWRWWRRANIHLWISFMHADRKDEVSRLRALQASIRAYDEAHALEPNNPHLLVRRGWAKLRFGRSGDDVLADLEQAKKVDPHNLLVGEQYLQLLLRFRRFDKAHRESMRLRILGPLDAPKTLKVRAALAAWGVGKTDEARQLFSEVQAGGQLLASMRAAQVPLWRSEVALIKKARQEIALAQ